MAEIYRAKTFDEHGVAHMVAVKRVLAHLVEDDDFIQMLVDEAKIASLLRHANIAQVYEFARAQGEYFIAMEYVDGKDVRTILERCRQRGTSVPPQHTAYVAAEIAMALHAAHSGLGPNGQALRIVHRDVSPSNVICAYTGEVKLCDFGIAKATLSRVQTKTGVIKGKVKYMSPEQAMGRKLDHRSDIFSLGSVAYEMLTKVPPFSAPNEMDLLIKVRDAKYRPIREIEPDVPVALERIVDRALMRSRTARYQTAEEFSAALRGFLKDYMPGYSRSYLGRYLRKMFDQEIERELRMLEDFVISEPDPQNVGVNLIADALPPNAPYSKFTPMATPRPEGLGDFEDSEAPTRPPQPPPSELKQHHSNALTLPEPVHDDPDLPGGPAIHGAETRILDRNRGVPVMPTARTLPRHPGSPGNRDPRDLDPAIHDVPTKIIKPK
jgi:serine/threonine-protein kinase